MVRKEAYRGDVEALGAESVMGDLTDPASLRDAVEGCDAAIFAAGSGGEDVRGVDRDGAIALMDAAEAAGVERFVMLSAMNADAPEESPEGLREYLRAKAEADDYLRGTDLSWTILRPGSLTDEPGTGMIRTGAHLDRESGTIPREDTAATLVASLDEPATEGVTFEVLSGETPIEAALDDPLGGA